MPAPDTLNREAVERALVWHGIDLGRLLETWGVRSPERWPDHPMVRDFLTYTAVQVHQARHMARGEKKTTALRAACEELGLKFKTVTSRLNDNRAAYLNGGRKSDGKSGRKLEKAG